METKVCTKCGEEKLASDFYRHNKAKDGRHTACAECMKAAINEHYATKRKHTKADYLRRRLYGTDGKELLSAQENKCAICGVDLRTLSLKARHIDHCHTTGKVRGWLCHRCNSGIGLLGESAHVLRKAASYLEAA